MMKTKSQSASKNEIITDLQRSIIAFIESHKEEHECAPTVREIGDHLKITVHAAYDHILRLRKKGLIDWRDGQSRTIRILKKGA